MSFSDWAMIALVSLSLLAVLAFALVMFNIEDEGHE
jgi:hypothetical protein